MCHGCGYQNPHESSFCCKCGSSLSNSDVPADYNEQAVQGHQAALETSTGSDIYDAPDSERKCVTVMFSDLTGYTEMSEKLDLEEVKEITSTIFAELSRIIEKYDGFIEKYIGDAILAVFGAKEAFEDAALRAIKAAREIHKYVETVSPKYEETIGRQLSMHTGINTGLVVTGEINYQKGTHGLVGDTINTAARLMSASKPTEIITDHDSYVQTKGYFDFDALEPVKVKGKAKPIRVYRVSEALQAPKKLHRLHGLRAELIGRSIEMQVLGDAAESLEQGKGSLVSVCGTAGTGKSRLVHEFKKNLVLEKFQWFDGNAYPYTQNTPYYPIIDLLTKAFGIEESDGPEAIKHRMESSLERLIGTNFDKAPYLGSLFSIEYRETSEVSPEHWKDQLYYAMEEVLKALTKSGPTVICLEDMHWADPSTMELVKKLISNFSDPLLAILIYRPVITVFTEYEIKNLKNEYTELRLRELSPSESQHMVCSLLQANQIPKDLRRFIRDSIDGNPFYVEELINSLIDSEALSMDSGQWTLTKNLDESFISTNIQGVIAGRIDRLGGNAKRILQEASVIGRAFLFDILQRTSEIKKDIDKNLIMLERLDLISARSIQPALEYIFKHALTQEIVYNGLVKSERQKIHKKIGDVIEILFQDRISEFYETLAYHFSEGEDSLKAVDYLSKSGEKCLRRYSLNEAHQYFSKAYELLLNYGLISEEIAEIRIAMIIKWALVFYYQGEFSKFVQIAEQHAKEAELIANQSERSLYYGWVGFSYDNIGQVVKGYEYLLKAADIAKKADDQKALAYCYSWLTWTCCDLAKFEEAEKFAGLAISLSKNYPKDHYLYFKSRAGRGWLYLFTGQTKQVRKIGENLIEYGERNASIRSQVMGYVCLGNAHYLRGDYNESISTYKAGINVCRDKFYSMVITFYLGVAYLQSGQYENAIAFLSEAYDEGIAVGGTPFSNYGGIFLGAALIAVGKMNQGMDQLIATKEMCVKNKIRCSEYMADYILGNIYSQIAVGDNALGLTSIIKNIGFVARNVPNALKKAEQFLVKTIENGKNVGSNFLVSHASYDLGLAYKAKRKWKEAREYLSLSKETFKLMGADVNLKKVQDQLRTLR
jgi:class 3 adenylate cyclase/tetratricopeptide (TPR) repeat protein